MKVEITKERILEASSKCSTAKATLMTLFPEVFKEDKYFKLVDLDAIDNLDDLFGEPFDGKPCISIAAGISISEELKGKHFLL